MQLPDRIDAKIRFLAAELDRIEAAQARGVSVVDALDAVVAGWTNCGWRRPRVGYLDPPHVALLERFRAQAATSRPWEA
jgi:hypothetical protein